MIEQFVKLAGENAAWAALAAIVLSNIVIWFAGGDWTPQKRAYVGIACVLLVLGVWYWADAASLPQDRPGVLTLLIGALVIVLAAAGAPVFKETFIRNRPDATPAIDVSESYGTKAEGVDVKPVRTWGVWSR